MFAILIVVLVILGIMKFNNAGTAAPTYETTSLAFGTGFIEGYQNSWCACFCCFLYYCNECIKQLGFKDKKVIFI